MSHALRAIAGRAAPNWTLDEPEFRKAMRDAEHKREEYYGDRLRACPLLQPEKFASWAATFKDDAEATRAGVAKALRISQDNADALVEQAIQAGLLESVRPGFYASPIPSLIDHIAHQQPTGHEAVGLGR